MAVHTYNSSTDFDKGLVLGILESNDGRKTVFHYTGFNTLGQAMEFCNWWEELHWGYSPYCYATQENGEISACCERWNSCD